MRSTSVSPCARPCGRGLAFAFCDLRLRLSPARYAASGSSWRPRSSARHGASGFARPWHTWTPLGEVSGLARSPREPTRTLAGSAVIDSTSGGSGWSSSATPDPGSGPTIFSFPTFSLAVSNEEPIYPHSLCRPALTDGSCRHRALCGLSHPDDAREPRASHPDGSVNSRGSLSLAPSVLVFSTLRRLDMGDACPRGARHGSPRCGVRACTSAGESRGALGSGGADGSSSWREGRWPR